MLVPITADASSYAAFWTRALVAIALGLGALLAPIYVLLYLILVALGRKP